MAALLDSLATIIQNIIQALGYPGLAFVMFAENVFPPIPSEIVMPFAGFLVARGEFSFIGILIAGTVGAVLGAVALYYIGLWMDEAVFRRFIRAYGKWFTVTEHELDRALAFFDKYGEAVIFFGRLIPIIRSLISIPAGMDRMKMPKFLLFTTLGTLTWNTILGGAGWFLGENWQEILEIIDTYEKVMYALMGLALLAFLVKRFIDWRAHRLEIQQEQPQAESAE